MYLPPHFEEERPGELERIIEEYPLGALVYTSPEGLDAAHLPFFLKKVPGTPGRLIAHVARKNPIWEQVPDGSGVLVIFRGVDHYVSPGWYPGKQETHRHVPTWNYQVVHVHGKIRFIDDPVFVRGAVALLTNIHETKTGEEKPWKMSDGDKDYIAQQISMIVGVEIGITGMTGKFKLSQNREERDKAGVVEKLRSKGDAAAADAIVRASREQERKLL